jgi:hypothetical protein
VKRVCFVFLNLALPNSKKQNTLRTTFKRNRREIYFPTPKLVISMAFGIMDAQGKWLLPCEYDFPVNEEDAIPNLTLHQSSKYGILDAKTIKWVLPCVYNKIESVNYFLYLVANKDVTYYVNKNELEYCQF